MTTRKLALFLALVAFPAVAQVSVSGGGVDVNNPPGSSDITLETGFHLFVRGQDSYWTDPQFQTVGEVTGLGFTSVAEGSTSGFHFMLNGASGFYCIPWFCVFGQGSGAANPALMMGNPNSSQAHFTFLSDDNTGMKRGGADILQLWAGGASRLNIGTTSVSPTVQLLVNPNTATSPQLLVQSGSASYYTNMTLKSAAASKGAYLYFAKSTNPVFDYYLGLDEPSGQLAFGTSGTNDGFVVNGDGDTINLYAGGTNALRLDTGGALVADGTAADPSLAFINDPDTGFSLHPTLPDIISFDANGAMIVAMSQFGMFAQPGVGCSGGMVRSASAGASTTLPGLAPCGDDLDTGIGWSSSDILNLIAGGATRFVVDTGGVLAATGTAASPSYSFIGDPDSGMASLGAGNVRFYADGVQVWNYAAGYIQILEPILDTAQDLTVADSGDGNPATASLDPTRPWVTCTCNDANSCDITMSEASAISGQSVEITNISANTCDFADTAGVSELAGAASLGQYDSLSLRYVVDRWVETSRSDN